MDQMIKDFLKDKRVLVVEPSSTTAHAAQKIFGELGLPKGNFFQAKKYDQAVLLLNDQKPQIVISEYEIENRFGLDLVAQHSELYKIADDRIFILITKNSEDSTVAEAVEEDVDGYLLKPFSNDDLKQKILVALQAKTSPNPYMTLISKSKRAIAEDQLALAEGFLNEAFLKSSKPSLAHYYKGHYHEKKSDWSSALIEYDKGLELQEIHFKCLSGKYNMLEKMGRTEEAYSTIKMFSSYFPMSPQRLGRMFWLAIQTKNYKEVAQHYNVYTQLERRPPQLVRIVSAGLLVGGKARLRDGELEPALEAFRNAISASGRDFELILKAVEALLEVKKAEEAEEFLMMVGPDDRHNPSFIRLDFKVGRLLRPKEQMVERGRQLVQNKVADIEIGTWTLEALVSLDFMSAAERLVDQIIALFPEARAEILKCWESLSLDSLTAKTNKADGKVA